MCIGTWTVVDLHCRPTVQYVHNGAPISPAIEHNPSPIILLYTYVGFYVALVQSETVRSSDLAQNLAKIKMSKIPVSFYCTPKNQIQKR